MMVTEFNYKGYVAEFWQDINNHAHYVIWLEEDFISSGVFPDPALSMPGVKVKLKELIDAL